MIESNYLIYWINHLCTHKYSNKPKFVFFLLLFFYHWFGSLNSQKKSVCSPQLFRFVVVVLFIYPSLKQKHDHANDDFQQTNTHTNTPQEKKTTQITEIVCYAFVRTQKMSSNIFGRKSIAIYVQPKNAFVWLAQN